MALRADKKGFSLIGFDKQHYLKTENYVQAIETLYNKAVMELSQLAVGLKVDPKKPFSFANFPATKAASKDILNSLASNMQAVMIKGNREQWLFACKKNDAFLASIMNTSKVPKKTLEKSQDKNLDALDSFQKRKVDGLDMSQRIWKYTGQFKEQIELGIDVALGEGQSAQQLSKVLRQHLIEPNNLFRRVRDKHGNLKLSKRAAAFHPGQGVYRSSYKNAMRFTRSEVNMAYRNSDQLRWEQLDFVVGYEVKLSNNHTCLSPKTGLPVRFFDICDVLAGKYPKTFVFKGWHPQCRCHVVPILMDKDEFNTDELNELKSAINGTEYKKFVSKNAVNDVPDGFKEWMVDNTAKSLNWTSQPYFIRDNFTGGTLAGAIKVQPVQPGIKKRIKTEDEKKAIQSAWDDRKQQHSQALSNGNTAVQGAKDFPEIDTSSLQKLIDSYDINAIEAEAKIIAQKVAEVKAEEAHLSTLLVDVKSLKLQHSIESVRELYKAVETKLASWDGLSIDKLKVKLEFEIDWVEKNKKYSTWKGSQDAFKKKLAEVNYKIAKQDVQLSVQHSMDYALKTMSKNVKTMADELKALLDNNAPLTELEAKSNALNIEVQKLEAKKLKKAKKATVNTSVIDPDAYSKSRKDQALWAKNPAQADKHVRPVLEDVWKNSSSEERRAAYYYTKGSSYINEPLRKKHYSGQYVGIQDGVKDANLLAGMIDRSTYDFDMWLQRGVDSDGVQGVFGIDLYGKDVATVRQHLLGKEGVEPAFSSCANAKGSGFSSKSVIYNIYCPQGTKMVYMEPYSAFGHGDKMNWNGVTKHSNFGSEAEMLLQRGTKFKVTKVDRTGSKWYIDLEVIGQ